MKVRRAAIVYTVRCPEPDCGCVHLFFADADETVFAEAVMPTALAEKVGADIMRLAHGGNVH